MFLPCALFIPKLFFPSQMSNYQRRALDAVAIAIGFAGLSAGK
jgi:hypothetical protein